MKTAISIPDAVFRKAERLAQRLKVSRSELYTRAIDLFVRSQDERAVRKALDEIYSAEDSNLDAPFVQLQAEFLDKGDW